MAKRTLHVIIFIVAALAAFLAPIPAQADRYVRADATGSGSGADWTNAYTSIATAEANVTRGETIWVADGTYGAVSFNVPASGTTPIYVKKAIPELHGADAGWNNTYGDGQAEIVASGTPVSISTNYWALDGQVGSGTSGHGFKATVTGTANASRGISITATGNITIAHWEITSANPGGIADADKQDGIYSVSASNVTIRNSYIHEWKRCAILLSGVTGWVIEGNYIYHTYSTSGAHGQAIQAGPAAVSNVDIRFNIFKDCHGTGFIVALDNIFDNFRIYGNVFWEEETSAAIGIYSTSQAIGTTTGDTGNYFKIHNNTFIGLNGRSPQPSGGLDFNNSGTGNEAYNNIWINCVVTFDTIAHDYNAYSGSSAFAEAHGQSGLTTASFVNFGLGDFRPVSATMPSVTLASPYNVDPFGNARGADGVWDRGAYELGGTGSPPLPPPTVPTPNPPDGIHVQ